MTSTAVILAAGRGTRLAHLGTQAPKGFIRVGSKPIITESLQRLRSAGIQRVYIVTGHLAQFYEALAAEDDSIITVHNADYATSGSMFSLYQLKNVLPPGTDFLLLESDLVYEQRALTAVQQYPTANCLLVSGKTNSGDEVWVQADQGNLHGLSKDATTLSSIYGELVGITAVSYRLFQKMCALGEANFSESLQMEYEEALTGAAREIPVPCQKIENLAWAEIDTEEHLSRVREFVYSRIHGAKG